MQNARLKRTVTFKEALAINIAAIIGAGIYVISGLAAGFAGPSAILSIAVGAVVAILTGISFAELAHNYAREGGNYEYSREVLGSYAGFMAGFIWLFATIISGSAVAISFGSYLLIALHIYAGTKIAAALLIVALAAINYYGIKNSARTALVLTIVNIAVLLFFIIVGIFYIKPGNFTPLFPKGADGFFVASAFIFFAYTGFARVTMLGEEIEEPKKNIPKAIIYSILISGGLYMLVMFVFIGIIPYASSASSSSPLLEAIVYATHSDLFGYIITAGALIATVNVDLAMILGLSRVTFAMARDKDLPAKLARLNKYGTPDLAVIFSAVIMVLAVFFINFKEIISLSNATALSSYAIANLAAMKLVFMNRNNPKKMLFKFRYIFIIPVLGVLSTLAMLFFLTSFSIMLLFAVLILATIYYVAVRAERERKGVEIKYSHEKRSEW